MPRRSPEPPPEEREAIYGVLDREVDEADTDEQRVELTRVRHHVSRYFSGVPTGAEDASFHYDLCAEDSQSIELVEALRELATRPAPPGPDEQPLDLAREIARGPGSGEPVGSNYPQLGEYDQWFVRSVGTLKQCISGRHDSHLELAEALGFGEQDTDSPMVTEVIEFARADRPLTMGDLPSNWLARTEAPERPQLEEAA